ncbi:MAG TPA: SMI1/KNR4 family protein [Abditibacterium sp.]|jgi:hypothetical protein
MLNRYAQKVEELKGKFIGLQGKQPIHVSEEEVQMIERELKALLPEDYTEFIRDYGDYFFSSGTTFPIKSNSRGIKTGGLEEVYGAIPSWGNSENGLVERYRGFCEDDKWPRNWLPIGAAGRDDRIALSIAGEDKGAVYLMVAHLLWETGEGAFRVANSFDEFIQSLYNVDEDDA